MKQDFYHDKDMTMITYTHDSGVMFSISNRHGSSSYITQCTKLGIYFTVGFPDMAVKIMKSILDK